MEQVGLWISEQAEVTNLVLSCFVVTTVSYEQASYVTQKSRFSQQANICFYKGCH